MPDAGHSRRVLSAKEGVEEEEGSGCGRRRLLVLYLGVYEDHAEDVRMMRPAHMDMEIFLPPQITCNKNASNNDIRSKTS